MKKILDDGKSIYLQIYDAVEDDILSGNIAEDDLIPSTNQFAKFYSINPATAAKGVGLLADEGIVYKKRGIGMCVSPGAKEIILEKRRRLFFEEHLNEFIAEAEKLGISKEEIIRRITEGK